MEKMFNRGCAVFVMGLLLIGNLSIFTSMTANITAGEMPVSANECPNLMLYYSFNNNQYTSGSDTVRDESVSIGVDGYNAWGKFVGTTPYGLAMRFYADTGTNGYVRTEVANKLSLVTGLTIEAWVYREPNDAGKMATIASHSKEYFWFYIDQENCLCFQDDAVYSPNVYGGVHTNHVASTNTIPIGKWTHVAVTRNFDDEDALVKLYINGHMDNAGVIDATSLANPDPNDHVYIGTRGHRSNGENWIKDHDFNGIIDELKIFDIDLEPKDGLGINTLKLNFEEGAGSYAYDRSGNDFVGGIAGVITWPSVDGMYGSRCYGFLGHNEQMDLDSYIVIGEDPRITLAGDMTIEVWIYFTGQETGKYTIAFCYGNYYFYLGYNVQDGGARMVLMPGQSPYTDGAISTGLVYQDKWTHVAVTREGDGTVDDSIKFYINGEFDSSAECLYDPDGTSSSHVYIGGKVIDYDAENLFIGGMDNLLLYNCIQPIDFCRFRKI